MIIISIPERLAGVLLLSSVGVEREALRQPEQTGLRRGVGRPVQTADAARRRLPLHRIDQRRGDALPPEIRVRQQIRDKIAFPEKRLGKLAFLQDNTADDLSLCGHGHPNDRLRLPLRVAPAERKPFPDVRPLRRVGLANCIIDTDLLLLSNLYVISMQKRM